MYIIIWDLLYQVGTYVRYFWGLLYFSTKYVRTHYYLGVLYQVRTYVHHYLGSITPSRYVRMYICTSFLGYINISLPSTYIHTFLSGIYYTK